MRFKSFLPGIIWFVVSLVLLALPGDDLPHSKIFNIPFFDKYIHLAMFFILTALFCYPFFYLSEEPAVIKGWFTRVTIYAIVYGILMEYVQKFFVKERSFDLADMFFDALGCLAGLVAATQIYGKKIGPNRNRGRNQN